MISYRNESITSLIVLKTNSSIPNVCKSYWTLPKNISQNFRKSFFPHLNTDYRIVTTLKGLFTEFSISIPFWIYHQVSLVHLLKFGDKQIHDTFEKLHIEKISGLGGITVIVSKNCVVEVAYYLIRQPNLWRRWHFLNRFGQCLEKGWKSLVAYFCPILIFSMLNKGMKKTTEPLRYILHEKV